MSRPTSIASSHQLNPLAPPKHLVADIFVINLRLLDLDLKPDWPAISVRTFSTRDAQQNQKQRIRCTEWALYRLFEIWDPEETRDKVQPFFPPLEPLQSLNLRAALYRSLNELKKNGILGRETILRKTMLDECKGDKLLEVLAIFSTAVIRRLELQRTNDGTCGSVSTTLATATMLDAVQQGSLLPLSVAYSASITSGLRKKKERKARFDQFSESLDVKDAQIKDRAKACAEFVYPAIDAGGESRIKQVLHDNWPGNSKWPHTILCGDGVNASDLPLQRPFDKVWDVIANGGQLPSELAHVGLLESLERRVNEQSSRLRKWHHFHDTFLGANTDSTKAGASRDGSGTKVQFKFDRHRSLRLGANIAIDPGRPLPESAQRYQIIVIEAKKEILTASKCRRERVGQDTTVPSTIFSPIKGPKLPPAETAINRGDITLRPLLASTGSKSSHLVESKTANILNGRHILETKPTFPKPEITMALPQSPVELLSPQDDTPQAKRFMSEMTVSSVENSPPGSPSSEEDLAEQIISSVVNSAPSPIKPFNLTLGERTRMSMAARPHISKIKAMEPPTIPKEPDVPGIEIHNRRATLLERTRQSMAYIPSSDAIKSKKPLPRQSRQSLFPVNQFETPGKVRPPPQMRRDATPTEKLFSSEAEYTSVFKSRPKIALSPVWTPESPALPAMGDLEEADSNVQEDTWTGGSSPLARRGIAH